MTAQAALVEIAALPALVSRAAQALAGAVSAAEVLDARDAARLTYDAARRAGRLARAKAAHDEVVAAAYRVQADALDIEAQASARLADEYDAAQARGELRRPGNSSGREELAGAGDVGLTHKQMHEARRVRDVLAENPGVVREVLDEMLDGGDEPTRSWLARKLEAKRQNLRAAVGTASASAAERGNNLYETPAEAVRALLALEAFSPTVWEPACGRGAIVRPLEDAGYEVFLSDLVDYSTADRHGECQRVADFLETEAGFWAGEADIVTNPPYGADLNRFVAHALSVHRPRRMALLLNLNFLCGFEDADRCFAMDENKPARVHVFTRRLPMMHRDGWDGPEAASRMNTAWFVWERDAAGHYAGPTMLNRVDWKDFVDVAPFSPCEAGGVSRSDEGGAVPPAAPPGSFLTWVEPTVGGRILAKLGAIEAGAVFPDADGKAEWCLWLGQVGATHKRARSVEAARKALAKEFTAKTGLPA